MMVFVVGATGKVGRHVVSGLRERGVGVQALVRDPGTAGLPAGVELVRGDLSDPSRLDPDADAVFLVWPFLHDDGAADAVGALARRAAHVVYLSAEAVQRRPDGVWGRIERLVEDSGVEWTFLRPTGFAANTLMWAPQIRDSGRVRWPYGDAARSLIHEADIAEVAVSVLTEDGHGGGRYVLSGPEPITQIDQVGAIGDAIGRPLAWEELPREDAERELAGRVPETALDTWAGFVDEPETVTPTVGELTGHAARTFASWARDHAADFR